MPASFPSVERMVANAYHERMRSPPTWSPDELRTIKSIKKKLSLLHPADPIDRLFNTIRSCYPLEGGMIESYVPFEPTEVADVLYDVSDAFIGAIAQQVGNDPTVDIISRLPAGVACRFVDAVPEPILREIPFIQATFTPYEFAGSSVLTLATGQITRPDENVALYLFHGKGERAPTWRDCRVLELIHEDIKSAISRMRLPVLPNEPIRYHIIRSERTGYAILRRDLELTEANSRAYAIATQYVDSNAVDRGCSPLVNLLRFVIRAESGGIGAGAPLMRRDGGAALRVNVHRLDKDLVELPESVFLVELDERPIDAGSSTHALHKLTPKQQIAALLDDVEQEIVRAMVTTRIPNKQIAIDMRLNFRAFEKRVQRIADKLNIHVSRGERVRPVLTQLLSSAEKLEGVSINWRQED